VAINRHDTNLFNAFEGGTIACPDAKTKGHIYGLKNLGLPFPLRCQGYLLSRSAGYDQNLNILANKSWRGIRMNFATITMRFYKPEKLARWC